MYNFKALKEIRTRGNINKMLYRSELSTLSRNIDPCSIQPRRCQG